VTDVLHLERTWLADRLLVHVTGDLDLATAPAFRQQTSALLSDPLAPVVPHVTVDLTACDHLDSVGLGLLLGLLKRCRVRGGSMAVVCPAGPVRRVLDLVDLDRLVAVRDQLGDPIASGGPGPGEGEA